MLAAGLLAAPVADARAGNFGSTPAGGDPVSQVSLADDLHHRVDFRNTTTSVGNAIQWALDNTYSDAGVTWQWVDDGDFDVRVRDVGAGDNGAFAWVNCPDSADEGGVNPHRWCHGQTLTWNLYAGYDYANDTVQERRSRGCHELGHTFGLRHQFGADADPTCMRLYDPDRAAHLSQHDVNHLDDTY